MDENRKTASATSSTTRSNLSSRSPGSRTSTEIYEDHEPFEQFKHRVYALCESLRQPRRKSLRQMLFKSRIVQYLSATESFGPTIRRWLQPPSTFEVERLAGGGYNRIIGINMAESNRNRPEIERQFILRIPRFEDARPDREVATAAFVQQMTNIPTVTMVAKDFSCNNALGKPYAIQRRIPGKDLQKLWAGLTHQQRCTVAREQAKTILELQSLTSSTVGLIETGMTTFDGRGSPLVRPYDLKDSQGVAEDQDINHNDTNEASSTLGFFINRMGRWRAMELRNSSDDTESIGVVMWDDLMDAAREMDKFNLFKNDEISFCHLDLQPRNIMAEIQKDQSLKVTGYLDWDSAVFAPKFVSCAPPRWLWDDDESEDDEEDELNTDYVPSTSEKQELKSVFEQAVGPDYLEYAYAKQYPLARMLFRIAKNGLWSSEQFHLMDKFLAEWDELRASLEI